MTDIPIEILRYEAKWSTTGEWEECSKDDYLTIRTALHKHPYSARVIGVVQDPAGLLLPGPKGYETWREAAVHEKAQRVDLEYQLRREINDGPAQTKLEEIRVILEREEP